MFCGWKGAPNEKFAIFLSDHFDEIVDEDEAIEHDWQHAEVSLL